MLLMGLGFAWKGWFNDLEGCGAVVMVTDNDCTYGRILRVAGLERQQCTVTYC